MKRIFLYTLFAGIISAGAACKKDTAFSKNDADVRVYMSQAVNGAFQDITVNRRAPSQEDSTYTFDVNAFFAGSGYVSAPRDINVTFAVDYTKWDSINDARTNAGQPAFEKIPEHIFSFGTTQSVIRKGTNVSEDISFGINARLIEEGHAYMIPVEITAADGYTLNAAMAYTYFVVKVTPPVFAEIDRSNWTIFDVDSEEASGEGPNNGRAIFALDGVLGTFWHTQWDGGEPPLPHHIAVDMQSEHSLSGLYLTARQNAPNGAPKTVNVEVSTNGTTWQSAGTYELEAINARQPVFFAQAFTARYFRVTVTATHGNTNITFFAEISAF
ncbi:discoidin domain-containing protein [Chitinophaga cymbidii]|uniref:Exo-alpha-sialidase n=1 Tax=Chitinophaga cymbidii TaxID=1096750 RepID=A0A512RLX3_9BACT|nr:discoidin domain-containing protein [Chitinophaga cymbidii]GEP96669.1 exo-alpha-sialidase [Chitinophaga cymbidii]